MRAWYAGALVLGCVGWCAGCAHSRAGGSHGAEVSASPFRAERLVIHPLTRIVKEPDGSLRIDAHFELLDRYGESVRELGEVEFAARGGGATEAQQPQALWHKDLRTGDASAAQFDRVTRMYVATLTGGREEALGTGRTSLLIRFTTLDGRELSATWREGR